MEIPVPPEIEGEMVFGQRLWDPELLIEIERTVASSSFRAAEVISNGLLRRDESEQFAFRTLQDTVCRNGRQMENDMLKMKDKELEMYGFDPKTGKPKEGVELSETLTDPKVSQADRDKMAEKMSAAIEQYNKTTDDPEEQVRWEALAENIDSIPDSTVVMCVDEIGVNQQKSTRGKQLSVESTGGESKKDAREGKHYEETTVVYLRSKEGSYRIAAGDVRTAVLIAFGYMLHWSLLQDRDLMIFSDGANNIKKVIGDVFAFRPYTLNLDWFHLRKHCYEILSMALVGGAANKERNNEIRYHFDKRLFAGNIDSAKQYLDSLDPSVIRNAGKIEELKKYLDRKEDGIYPYAIRKVMGYINSSNQGEKSNDLVVAQRCKHNGMSWTSNGITGIRNVNLAFLNNETNWYRTHRFSFEPIPLTAAVLRQYQDAA